MSGLNIESEKIEYLKVVVQKTEINNVLRNPMTKEDSFDLSYIIKATDFYNLNENLIRVIIDATIIVIKDKKEINAGAKFEIENYFSFEDLKKFAKPEENRVLVEFKIAEIFKELAYSTSRGIIISKLSGTFLEKVILPVLMPTGN